VEFYSKVLFVLQIYLGNPHIYGPSSYKKNMDTWLVLVLVWLIELLFLPQKLKKFLALLSFWPNMLLYYGLSYCDLYSTNYYD